MKYSMIIYIALAILLAACEKNKTPLSGENNNYTSHNYQWEIDTLHAPGALQVLMYDVWGTDENNVWVVGHSDVTKYQVWHWDGEKWENHYLLFPGHPHSLEAIYGFSEDDIWIVGDDIQNYPNIIHRDFIIHYDGNDWEHFSGLNAPQCLSVWGSDPNNVFVGCDSGLVLYYDGSQWVKQNTGTISRIYSITGFNSQEIFAVGYHLDEQQPIDSTFHYFFRYDGTEWKVEQSFINTPFSPPEPFGYQVWASPERELYSVGYDGLYLWKENSWIRLLKETLFAIYGTGENNMFTGGRNNTIIHYNGVNWHYYDDLPTNLDFIGEIWCNKGHVFMTAQYGNASFIIRGKLIERR